MIDRKKVFLSLIVLATLVASIVMIVGNVGNWSAVHAQQASRKGVTATDFYAPTGSFSWGTTFDSQGRVWLAMPGCDPSPHCQSGSAPGKIDVYDPATRTWPATYALPSGYGQPLFLAFDQRGILWFPMPMTNSIAMFNPANNTFQSWPVPTAASGPWGVAVDSQGIIWFTEHYANKIGSFNPTTHVFNEIATPATNSQPYGITVDSSDNVWFTENNPAVALIAEYPAGGGKLKEYQIRTGSTNGLTPHLIVVDSNGNIWWSEGFVGAVGELKIALAKPGTINGVTEYPYHQSCSNCGSHTSGISVDSHGKIWFDDSLQSIYGSFPESGNGAFALYNTPSQNAHPHDGLNVDKQDRIWFDEEFMNKLALAIQSGGGTPTPTPTMGTPTLTPTTPTTTPTPGQTLGQDTFQRANQKYWGRASDGQAWGGDANSVNAFSIAGNAGVVSNGGGNSYSAVLGKSATNAQVVFSGSLSSYNNANIGVVLRWTDGNDWYKAYISGNTFYIQKRVAGATAFIASTAFTPQANTSYTIHFQAIGSTLSANVWATGSTEPSGWMITATDSSFSSGYCGIRMLTQGGTATFTSFKATSL
ncbi:MAG: hypothetical protein NVSMB38_17210 [Ktedonobacteraceae bacterium]